MPIETEIDLSHEIADLPSDAFASSGEDEYGGDDDDLELLAQADLHFTTRQNEQPRQSLNGFRQTTLFGGRVTNGAAQLSSVPVPRPLNRKYICDLPPEEPTNHALNEEALQTWVYPTNLGEIRDYQFSITRKALFHNTLVALPTGLGKTFIAATVMLNFYRWTKDAQIVFMAPTKPLVTQQIDACFNIVGIPRSCTTLLTGEVRASLRAEEWATKRVFFMTPQTLDNDLRTGIADPKRIVLLVVDEAHRATGNYAYVKVISMLRRFAKSFRILALTATPGSNVEAVQDVINNLEISEVEIRQESSLDIRQYIHGRQIDQVVLDPTEEMVEIQTLLARTLQPLVDKLCGANGYYNRDPLSLTPYGMMKAQDQWAKSPAGRAANFGLKAMMRSLFTELASISHGLKLLNFHGIGPFYQKMKDWKEEAEKRGKKLGKYKTQILENEDFKKMMNTLQAWINTPDFIGHPKLIYLCDTILNHFLDKSGGPGVHSSQSSTRIIVFSEFRDSAEEIVRTLNKHKPMIRATVFVGQAATKNTEGMKQAQQIQTISDFKDGKYNVLVATSIGEEGLDIGQVDLIVCYDASASPIRMLQRLGRTGRKRAGKITLLLMRGKEENAFAKAQDNYEHMQKLISNGDRFAFRNDLSVRIIPRGIDPKVDKKQIEIPIENTQDPSLPEPGRRRGPAKKRPPKKFNMPDNVETGFQTVSAMLGKGASRKNKVKRDSELNPQQAIEKPAVEDSFLAPLDLITLQERYQNIAAMHDDLTVSLPDINRHPVSQRVPRPTAVVTHGKAAHRFVNMVDAMHTITDERTQSWSEIYFAHGTPDIGLPHLVNTTSLAARGTSRKVQATANGNSRQLKNRRVSNHLAEMQADDMPDSGDDMSLADEDMHTAYYGGLDIGSSLNSMDDVVPRSDDTVQTDLDGFIVDDDDLAEYESGSEDGAFHDLTTPRGPQHNMNLVTPKRDPTPTASNKFFEPTTFMATQESEDDMPELGAVLRKRDHNASMISSNEPDYDIHDHRKTKRTRKVIEDSEDSSIE
jgi:ATP-dependent DNA helicase MPH1